MEENVKKSGGLFLVLTIFIGLGLRLFSFAQNPSFNFDESSLAYNVLSLKYIDLFGILNLQQVAPPMFLVLTKWVVSIFGTSEIYFRSIPLLFGCFAFIPFYYLLNKVFDNNPIPINFGMFLFAINPKLIYFCSEFKHYSLDVFFSILIFWAFLKIDLKTLDWKKLLFIATGMSVTVWFSFSSVILLFVGLLTLLLSQKEYKKWFVFALPFLFNTVLFGLYYFNIFSFYKDFMEKIFGSDFNHITIPVSYFFNNTIPFAVLITSIALAVGIMYFMAEKKRFEIAFMMWTFILTIFLSFFHLYPAYQYFMMFLLPYAIIILSMVFSLLVNQKNFQSRLVLIIILLSLIPTTLSYKKSQARNLTNYFINNLNSEDVVVVDNLALPYFLYYTRDTKMDNTIIVPFKKVEGKVLYELDSKKAFPTKYDTFWFYATNTKDFENVIEKENNIEKIKDYKIINKMVTKEGAVIKLSKND